jgi:hypothetical protein
LRSESGTKRRKVSENKQEIEEWKSESAKTRVGGGTPRVLYRCENTRVAGKGFCNVMKTKEKKIDSGERVETSLEVSERRPCGHEADLDTKVTRSGTVLSSKI